MLYRSVPGMCQNDDCDKNLTCGKGPKRSCNDRLSYFLLFTYIIAIPAGAMSIMCGSNSGQYDNGPYWESEGISNNIFDIYDDDYSSDVIRFGTTAYKTGELGVFLTTYKDCVEDTSRPIFGCRSVGFCDKCNKVGGLTELGFILAGVFSLATVAHGIIRNFIGCKTNMNDHLIMYGFKLFMHLLAAIMATIAMTNFDPCVKEINVWIDQCGDYEESPGELKMMSVAVVALLWLNTVVMFVWLWFSIAGKRSEESRDRQQETQRLERDQEMANNPKESSSSTPYIFGKFYTSKY